MNNSVADNIKKHSFLDPERSFVLGFWLVLLPGYFIFCALMKFLFVGNMYFLNIVGEFWANMNKGFYFRFLSPLLLVGGPVVAVFINLLSLIRIKSDKFSLEAGGRRKFLIRLNVFVCFLGFAILFIFILFGIKKYL
jgi:lantibiotic transport system permease protein